MKLGKLRTLRGQIVASGGLAKKNLIVADGLVNYGLKVLSFRIWNEQTPTTGSTFTGILSLDTINSGTNMNAGDNRQIAWTFSNSNPLASIVAMESIIDPDHIVNRDLYLSMDNTSAGVYNYLIEAQVVELTDDEAIITIIKESSQA